MPPDLSVAMPLHGAFRVFGLSINNQKARLMHLSISKEMNGNSCLYNFKLESVKL
jgi:hypothetical protein